MDSQHILEQLASLRENLSAIESARQQVQNNVAEYEKVRLQLSDTANSIKNILDSFGAIVEKIEDHQFSIVDDVEESKAAVIEILNEKSAELARQSQLSVDSLKGAVAKLDGELSKATTTAIQQLTATSSKSNQQLNDALDKIKGDFGKSVDSSIEALQACVESVKKDFTSASNGFEQSVNHSLTTLDDATKEHLKKYQSFEAEISEEIKKITAERQKLEKFADQLNETIKSGFKTINDRLETQASQIENLASSSASQTEEVKGAVKKSMIISIIAVVLMLVNLVVLLIR